MGKHLAAFEGEGIEKLIEMKCWDLETLALVPAEAMRIDGLPLGLVRILEAANLTFSEASRDGARQRDQGTPRAHLPWHLLCTVAFWLVVRSFAFAVTCPFSIVTLLLVCSQQCRRAAFARAGSSPVTLPPLPLSFCSRLCVAMLLLR